MIFSVFNDVNESSLDFGPDSVTLTIWDTVQKMTINSQKCPLAARILFLSEKQAFLNNHLAQDPITGNPQRTNELRYSVVSNVGAQDMETSEYQLSDLIDVEFHREIGHLEADALFRPGIDTPYTPSSS